MEVVKMGECVLCEQQITNPLSSGRLAEQMKTWLMETKPELIQVMEKKAEEVLDGTTGDSFCVVTGRKMNLCAYCFTKHIFDWLLSTKPSQDMVDQYLTYFSFDVSRKGYIQTAEKAGYFY